MRYVIRASDERRAKRVKEKEKEEEKVKVTEKEKGEGVQEGEEEEDGGEVRDALTSWLRVNRWRMWMDFAGMCCAIAALLEMGRI